MLMPRNGTQLSQGQERHFTDFFQEEFADSSDPLGSRQKRETVSRKTIHAAFADMARDFANPSDTQNAGMVIHGAFSGYVHGAYPHIMELYGGLPRRFHLHGMLGTPREAEWNNQLVNQIYRALMASEFVARKLGHAEATKAIRELVVEFETTAGCAPDDVPEALMRRAKKPK
jgi:hypothetical protein